MKRKRKILARGRSIELTWGDDQGLSEVIILEGAISFTSIGSIQHSSFDSQHRVYPQNFLMVILMYGSRFALRDERKVFKTGPLCLPAACFPFRNFHFNLSQVRERLTTLQLSCQVAKREAHIARRRESLAAQGRYP